MKISTLLTALFLLSAISCKKESNTDCVNNSPWYRDGVRLAYKNYPILISDDSLIINIKKISDNRFESQSDLGALGFGSFQEICGNKVYQASTSAFNDKYLVYDLDASVGATWNVEAATLQGNAVTHTITVKQKNASITVPAGTFTGSAFEIVSKIGGR